MKTHSASWPTRAAAELELRRRRLENAPALAAQLARWRTDPFLWAQERLGLNLRRWADYGPERYAKHKWDGTKEPLGRVAEALANGDSAAVSSGTGLGKTYLGGVLLLWFADCWEGAQIITIAPKEKQLTLHIWKEIGKLWPLFQRIRPLAQLDTLRIRMRPGRDDWGAVGFAVGVAADEEIANKARGFHAEHMLFIIEETTGVHAAVLAAIALTCTAPHNLRLFFGNRDSVQDTLGKVSKEPGVIAIRASAHDHPNIVLNDASIIPGAQSPQVLTKWRTSLGADDPIYQSRARGIAPAQGQQALIRMEWLAAAAKRAKNAAVRALLEVGEAALGVDVANSETGDKASIAEGKGRLCKKIESQRCPDANAFGRQQVYPFIKSGQVRRDRVGVDTVGVGVGTVNELRRLGAEVVALNGGESMWENEAEDNERFANLRAQMYWRARTDLQETDPTKAIGVPDDEELFEDLMAPKWRTHNGKIIVESKEDLKVRLDGRSPDKGDAFVYWNWVRQAHREPEARQVPVVWG